MYVLDTNALSEPLRRRPHPRFMERLKGVPPGALFTSTICVMELRYGCTRKGDQALWERIERELLVHVQVLPLGLSEGGMAGDLLAALRSAGRTVGFENVQIAATALARGFVVVTANEAHFGRIPGLRVENWLRGA